MNGVKLDLLLEMEVCTIEKEWQNGDEVVFNIPMKLSQSVYVNQNSRSINYGPLTFSLKIKENYEKVSSIETAIGDSKWQKDADQEKWLVMKYIREVNGIMPEIDDLLPIEKNFKL